MCRRDVAQPQVWLERPSDRQRAERVLAALQSERRQSGTVHCAACGEDNPGKFRVVLALRRESLVVVVVKQLARLLIRLRAGIGRGLAFGAQAPLQHDPPDCAAREQ